MSDDAACQCWNCARLVLCMPTKRPQHNCSNFVYCPYHKITKEQVSELLLIDSTQLESLISEYGVEKVIELLAIRGHRARVEQGKHCIKWYI